MSVEQEAVVVAFRRHTLLPLDDCLYALQPTIPHLTRSSLHRCLQRHGISRLPQVEGEASPKRKFKPYPIGYFHIDIAEVRTAQGRLYLIVAIDRTSKFAFVELHEKVTRKTAADFLRRLIEAVPYRVHTVLTDNGTHFTDPGGETWSPAEIKQIDGGALLQVTDRLQAEGDDPAHWTLATGEALSPAELRELAFAWKACRAVKSNAILLAKDGASVGVGMGQVNRVDSCKLAVERAGEERARGSYAASDAFFPFPDGPEILIAAGVKAMVQPGGSIRDELVVEAAKKAGVTMYVTGTRHFFH